MAIFDRTFLPPKSCEFVVLSDTHYLLHPELQGGEWESIRAFPARAERALRLAGALQADFCAHLGDVTHEYPETGRVGESRAGAQAQFARHGLRPYVAAGNMDIGDKPDPTSPAEWVTPETLADWQAAFGPSWFSFDQGEIHGVVLNSVIMNGPLPEAEAQARWLEADLAAHHGQRIILFMHLPPFFVDEGERAFGMYNSLDDPARGWLLDLIRHHAVEAVFAGHTHFVGLNRVGATRLFIAPSTTTSRAGLPEAFTVCPPDRGRSDVDKLGFYFVRVDDRGLSVHLIRTGRETAALDDANPRQVLLTCPSRDLPHSPLGVVATHPLGHLTPGPIIWPSVVRQRVRDDWRLFACLELGARHVRIPESDLDDPMERDRLPVLRGEGVSVIASWLWSPRADLTRLAGAAILGDPARAAAPRDLLDEVEVVVPGDPLPDPACLAQIRQVRKRLEGQKGREHGLPVTLSTALRTAPAGPRYHGRTRVGYRPDELPALDEWLGRHDAAVDHVVCRVYADDPPWAVMQQVRTLGPLRHLGAVDLAFDLPDTKVETHAALVAEAIFAAAALPGARIWLGPLLDLDRSMDEAAGLLDRLSNPRPAFTAARTLNTVLFAAPPAEPYRPADAPAEAPSDSATGRVLALATAGRRLWLVLPSSAGQGADAEALAALIAAQRSQQPSTRPPATRSTRREIPPLACYHLVEGTSERVAATSEALLHALARTPGPTLLMAEP